jgi:hypothetical protein
MKTLCQGDLQVDSKRLASLFNEWQRRYIEEPHSFEVDFKTIIEFLKDESDGVEPSYGQSCAAYLAKLDGEFL